MNNPDILLKLKKVNDNLSNAKKNLESAKKLIGNAISFNSTPFKSGDIKSISGAIDKQSNTLTYTIIPAVQKM